MAMKYGKKVLGLVLLGALSSGAAQAALHDRGGGLLYDDVLDVTWLADANYAKTSGYDADGWMNWQQALTWAANLSYYDSVRGVTYDDWRLPRVRDGGLADVTGGYSGTDTGYNVRTVGEDGTVYSELAHMYFNNLGFKSLWSPDTQEVEHSYYDWVVDESGDWHEELVTYWEPAGEYRQTDCGIFRDCTIHWGEELDGVGPNGAILHLQPFGYWSGTAFLDSEERLAWGFGTFDGGQYNAIYQDVEAAAWAVRPGDVAAVPEPVPAALFGVGLAGLMLARRRGRAVRV